MSNWTGDQEMVEMLRRTGALDEADAIFDALDEAERTGDYELVSELLGPMLSPAQVRERLNALRRTPENVECRACSGRGLIPDPVWRLPKGAVVPCPDCTPDNVEEPT